MKGKVLIFNIKTKRGFIQDRKGNLYSFHIGEWLSGTDIKIGKDVYFDIPKEEAINIRTVKIFFLKKILQKFKNSIFTLKQKRRYYEENNLKETIKRD